MTTLNIDKTQAMQLIDSKWWDGKPPSEIARFQLCTDRLCMPFSVFHEAIESALGRPVWTHELAMDRDGIWQELVGERESPTMQQILEIIPKEKRIIVAHP